MTADAPAPDTGFLTVEQATNQLTAAQEKEQAPAAPQEAAPAKSETETTAETTAEDTSGAETQTEGEKAETEETETQEVTQPSIEPPKFWDKDSKDRFKALDPEVQKIIVAKEDERTKAVARQMQEAAESKKKFEDTSSKYAATVATLDKIIPQAKDSLSILQDQFTQKWGNVDWNATVDQYGADATLKLRNQMETERAYLQAQYGRIQQLETAKAEADNEAHNKFVAEEAAKLSELAPELTDPKLGPERKAALGKFLVEQGADPKALAKIPAWQAAIAYDAMKWRNGQAKADALIKTPQPVQTQARRTPAKPTASASAGTTQQARIDVLNRKQELSIDEAVELANLKGSQAA